MQSNAIYARWLSPLGLCYAHTPLLAGRIADLLENNPDLSVFGWHSSRAPTPGRRVRLHERMPLDEERECIDTERVRCALYFIKHWATPTQAFRHQYTSQRLAIMAGRYGASWELSDFVAPGEFIVAALLEGRSCKRDPEGPDCVFNMSISSRPHGEPPF